MWKRNKPSKGEVKIAQYLIQHQIGFTKEKQFKDLRNPKTNQKLRLDFYLPKFNIAIEFDGQQHSKLIEDFHGSGDKGIKKFAAQIFKDHIKNMYCRVKGIKLIRISYLQYLEIEEILNKELK